MGARDDEFAEFDTDEATFDAMMARAEPATLVEPSRQRTVVFVQSDETHFTVMLPTNPLLSVGLSGTATIHERVVETALNIPHLRAPLHERVAS
jgi:hypothetical protein